MLAKGNRMLIGAAALIPALLFVGIIALDIPTDIQLHSRILVAFVKEGGFPVPPGYYGLIYVLSGFSLDGQTLNRAAIVVLTAAVTCKYLASVRLANVVGDDAGRGPWRNAAMLLVMLLAPIFYDITAKSMYLGKIAPNVWHNSTTITVMPIVILTFLSSLSLLKNDRIDRRNILLLVLLGIANIMVKPSFLFCLIPVLPLIALLRHGMRSRVFLVSCGISFVLLAAIGIQYYIIYRLAAYSVIYHRDSGSIAIAPFLFWSIYSKHIILDVFFSLIFPIAFLILYPDRIRTSLALQYALLLFLVAIAIGILLCESGERLSHGNFFWQIVMTSYILFAVITALALDAIRSSGWFRPASLFLLAAFGVHLATGLLYIFKIFYTHSYW